MTRSRPLQVAQPSTAQRFPPFGRDSRLLPAVIPSLDHVPELAHQPPRLSPAIPFPVIPARQPRIGRLPLGRASSSIHPPHRICPPCWIRLRGSQLSPTWAFAVLNCIGTQTKCAVVGERVGDDRATLTGTYVHVRGSSVKKVRRRN